MPQMSEIHWKKSDPSGCVVRVKSVGSAPMFTRSMVIGLLCLGLGSIASARADGLAIKGQVKGTDGKPLAGAQVRVQRADGKGQVLTTATDSKGEYAIRNLDLAPYAITTVINKKPVQVASIRTRQNAWVRADFDLSATASASSGKAAPKRKRMVWVAGETGTHIGAGHWETVEDSNTGVGASAVQRVDGSILQAPNNGLNPSGGVAGPGH
jgi:Carboxypeptidase regulatory-like domain